MYNIYMSTGIVWQKGLNCILFLDSRKKVIENVWIEQYCLLNTLMAIDS